MPRHCRFLWVSLALASAGCERSHPVARPYPDPTFNAVQWRRDSTGCLGYRAQHYESLREQAPFFRGKPVSFLRRFLGPPQVITTLGSPTEVRYFYAAGCSTPPLGLPAQQESAFERAKLTYRDVPVVVFELRADTCRRVRLMIP
ncbi:hypothetical protein I2I05_20795 [Hymenobacter sp. BT683]|uniref:Lipoprotein n=1 Tax=Hymenobacter jeongseonensis TaxID=2791027 RepID=A0ABS0IN97_9BACT|nr:hypothetical protein [Hymenobacter jeongseonensis]MBF9239844.1 hypothetical protein [Hymenobacter jeongseonensis]